MEQTISYDELSERAQAIIDRDSDGQRIWYVDGKGKPHGVETGVYDLFIAQGGPDPDWKRVEFGM